jgi:hypothetical protein
MSQSQKESTAHSWGTLNHGEQPPLSRERCPSAVAVNWRGTWVLPFFASLAISAMSFPSVSHAQSVQISPAQMHTDFERAGLIAGPITDWWTGDASTFMVVDPRETGWLGRVVLVLVYRDADV